MNTYPKLYRKYFVLGKVGQMLYLKLQKALYGLLQSALLFYLELSIDLKNNGFIINPHDTCETKKWSRGKF